MAASFLDSDTYSSLGVFAIGFLFAFALGFSIGRSSGRNSRSRHRGVDEIPSDKLPVVPIPDKIYLAPINNSHCFKHLDYLSGKNNADCTYRNCGYLHKSTLIEIYKLLCSVRRQIDIAMFQFLQEDLANLLIHLHKTKGINIRIITHHECKYPQFDKIPKLQAEGIKVKINDQNNTGLMHAKYAIVDHRVLTHGSANWTRHAFELNSEHVVITRDKETIRQFSNQFEDLWSKYSPRVAA